MSTTCFSWWARKQGKVFSIRLTVPEDAYPRFEVAIETVVCKPGPP